MDPISKDFVARFEGFAKQRHSRSSSADPSKLSSRRTPEGRQKLDHATSFRDPLRLNQRQCASRIVNSGLPVLAPFALIRRHLGAFQQCDVFHRRSLHTCTLSTPRSSTEIPRTFGRANKQHYCSQPSSSELIHSSPRFWMYMTQPKGR
jgi:hypothetical protein